MKTRLVFLFIFLAASVGLLVVSIVSAVKSGPDFTLLSSVLLIAACICSIVEVRKRMKQQK